MDYRINTRVVAGVGALVLIAVGLFVYTIVSAPTEVDLAPVAEQPADVPERLITARHQYVDGIHTIAGMVTVPTSCHRLVSEPFLLEGGAVVEVRFNTLMEGEECPRQDFEVPFRVTFEAGEGVEIRATWDGAPVRLNLVPVGPGESLDDELYFKG